jgi:hypothetical protein
MKIPLRFGAVLVLLSSLLAGSAAAQTAARIRAAA